MTTRNLWVRRVAVALVLGGAAANTADAGLFGRKKAAPPQTAAPATTPESVAPDGPIATPDGKPIITLSEPGKPAEKGVIERSDPQPDGSVKHRVKMLRSGEVVELVDQKGRLADVPPAAVAPKAVPATPAKATPAPAPTFRPIPSAPAPALTPAAPAARPSSMDGLILPHVNPVTPVSPLAPAIPAPLPATPTPAPAAVSAIPASLPGMALPVSRHSGLPSSLNLPAAQERGVDPLMVPADRIMAPAREASEGRLFRQGAHGATEVAPPKKPSFWRRITGRGADTSSAKPVRTDAVPTLAPVITAPTMSAPVVTTVGAFPGTARLGEYSAPATASVVTPVAAPVSVATVQPVVAVEPVIGGEALAQIGDADRPSEREGAILAVCAQHATLPEAVERAVLTAGASDPAVGVRVTAVRALSEKGCRSEAFKRLLTASLNDRSELVRIEARAATEALGR